MPQYSPPPLLHGLFEARVALDLIRLPLQLSRLKRQAKRDIGKGRDVFVLPGFGATENMMNPMRLYLKQFGFNALHWGLGTNKAGLNFKHDPQTLSWDMRIPSPYRGEAGVAYLSDQMVARVREHTEQTGKPVSLVGWSLGGTIAREVARDIPQHITQVVTLGSPFIGGPKYTRAANALRRRGLDIDWIEAEVARRNEIPLKTPLTAIVSRYDGIVDRSASVLPDQAQVEYIETNVAHLSMGFHLDIMSLVIDSLVNKQPA